MVRVVCVSKCVGVVCVCVRVQVHVIMRMRSISPKRLLGLMSSFFAILAVIRASVLFVESLSVVHGERAADRELLRLCANREAMESADFRALCLAKRADQSAPLIFKALLRSVHTSFVEFAQLFSSPGRVAILILFVLTGAAAPVIKTVCNVLLQNVQKRGRRRRSRPATSDSESDLEDQGDSSQIVLLQHHNSARSLFHRGKQNSHKIIEMPTDMIDYTTE